MPEVLPLESHLTLPTLIHSAATPTGTEHSTWMRGASLSLCNRLLDATEKGTQYVRTPNDTEICSHMAIMASLTDLSRGTSTLGTGAPQATHRDALYKIVPNLANAPIPIKAGVEAGADMLMSDAIQWTQCAAGQTDPHAVCEVQPSLSATTESQWVSEHAPPVDEHAAEPFDQAVASRLVGLFNGRTDIVARACEMAGGSGCGDASGVSADDVAESQRAANTTTHILQGAQLDDMRQSMYNIGVYRQADASCAAFDAGTDEGRACRRAFVTTASTDSSAIFDGTTASRVGQCMASLTGRQQLNSIFHHNDPNTIAPAQSLVVDSTVVDAARDLCTWTLAPGLPNLQDTLASSDISAEARNNMYCYDATMMLRNANTDSSEEYANMNACSRLLHGNYDGNQSYVDLEAHMGNPNVFAGCAPDMDPTECLPDGLRIARAAAQVAENVNYTVNSATLPTLQRAYDQMEGYSNYATLDGTRDRVGFCRHGEIECVSEKLRALERDFPSVPLVVPTEPQNDGDPHGAADVAVADRNNASTGSWLWRLMEA